MSFKGSLVFGNMNLFVFCENKAEESPWSIGNLSFWPLHQMLFYFFFHAGYVGKLLKYYHFPDNVCNFLAYVPSFKPLRIIHSSTKTWVKYITNFPQRIYIFSSCLDSLSKTWPDLSSPSIVLGFYFFDFDLFNVIISKLSQ